MKILKNIINVVLILIIDICVYKVYIKSKKNKKADKSYEQIRIEKQEESLYDKYEDYRGWIKINNIFIIGTLIYRLCIQYWNMDKSFITYSSLEYSVRENPAWAEKSSFERWNRSGSKER